MSSAVALSDRGVETRQRIYRAAIACFQARGYKDVTMREIAEAAGVSVGLSYRYFPHKEEFVLQWYGEHVEELAGQMAALESGQLADRYYLALESNLRALQPMRAAVAGLFGAAMAADSGVALMENPQGRRLAAAYRQLVLESEDALREPKATHMGIVLYIFHMLIVLFWLYDRSPEQATTRRLLAFVREVFKLLRPMFFLPMAPQGIAKLAGIVMPAVAGEASSIGAAAQDHARDR